ncbi:hypothetical protein BX666DRAFT_1351319 [Dichotomocladium elegans]|nr:hypothetical protein BX666DRAFT_1351319 [Dichotomocladium elegans]
MKKRQPASSKIARLPSTKDVIAYVVDQVNKPSTDPMITSQVSPDMNLSSSMTPSLGGTSPSTSSACWRPLTPPRDISGDEKSPALVNTSLLPPSPPLQAIAATPATKVPTLPPVRKFSQSIRGYERWTEEDDKMLMGYILKRMRGDNWNNLAARFGGRHSSSCCKQRWEYLQRRLLKHIALPPASNAAKTSSVQDTTTEE